MEKRLKYVLLSLILISLSAKLALVFFNQGMWWDEAVYLGLGEGVLNGHYSIDAQSAIETFRPPLFPVIISFFAGNALLVRIIVVLISMTSVAATYFLARELFGKEAALWACAFVSANQLFIFFSTKALTEPLFISLASVSLLLLFRSEKKLAFSLLSGIVAGLAFLTRYLGTILVFSYFLYFLFLAIRGKKRARVAEGFVLFIAGFVTVLSPWLAVSFFAYGSVLGAYFTNLSVFSGGPASSLLEHASGVFDIFGLLLPFMALGMYVFLKQLKRDLPAVRLALLAAFSIPLAFVVFAPHVEPRYLLSYIPVYAVFFGVSLAHGIGALKRNARFLVPAALILIVLSMIAGLGMIWNDRNAAVALVEGSRYLRATTNASDVVMSESYPYLYYIAERRTVRFPENPDDLAGVVKDNGVGYVLLYKFEPGNPAYTATYFENNKDFEPIKSFEQWGDPGAVTIYRAVR
jgi:4-amino-4-deoxy-L-arabinose transferase-like glycosyltransferase